jgi:hypothetical protein
MRTARRVIVCLLVLSVEGFLPAQQAAPPAQSSVDTDVTITGSDDSVIPIPAPAQPDYPLVLPPLDTSLPPAFIVPPFVLPVVPRAVPPELPLGVLPAGTVQARSDTR